MSTFDSEMYFTDTEDYLTTSMRIYFSTKTDDNMMTSDSLFPVAGVTLNQTTAVPTVTTALPVTAPPESNHIYPVNMLGFTAACAFIIAIFGTFGNLLTILALPLCKKLRTTATAFVVNLAVVELLFCVIILPMSGAQYAYLQYTLDGLLSDEACVYFTTIRYVLTQVELQTILAIALMRAIAVSCTKLYSIMNRAHMVGAYIALIWLYSFALKLPTSFGIFGNFQFHSRSMECGMATNLESLKALKIQMIVEAYIPVSCIAFLYIFIFIKVKISSSRVARSSLRSTKASVSTPQASVANEEPSDSRQVEDRKGSSSSFRGLKKLVAESNLRSRFRRKSSSLGQRLSTSRRDMRVARMIFIIFLVFLVCSVPVAVIHFVDYKVTQPRRFLAVHILYWLQYCLNMGVYVLMNRQYRDAYVECLGRILPSWKHHKGFRFPWEAPSMSSRPHQGLNDSFRSRNDSVSQDPLNNPTKDGPQTNQFHQGRLSAIPEANTSSAADDDVFVDDSKNCKTQDSTNPEDGDIKMEATIPNPEGDVDSSLLTTEKQTDEVSSKDPDIQEIPTKENISQLEEDDCQV